MQCALGIAWRNSVLVRVACLASTASTYADDLIYKQVSLWQEEEPTDESHLYTTQE